MQTQEQAQNQETIKPNTKVIELEDGFNRKGTVIKEITLIKPNTSHCRGLSLKSVLNFEIDALAVLLTRIALPAMTEQEVYTLVMFILTIYKVRMVMVSDLLRFREMPIRMKSMMK